MVEELPTPPPADTTKSQGQSMDSTTGDTGSSSREPEVESASMAQPTPPIDTYQQAFPQICEFALLCDLPALVQYAELFDLKVTRTFTFH